MSCVVNILWQRGTCVSHGAEDVLGDVQDAVGGLAVTTDGLPAAGVLLDVLQQLVERLRDAGCRGAHLLEQMLVGRGALGGLHTALHRLGHQLARLDQLLLTHRGADGGGNHLVDGGGGGGGGEREGRKEIKRGVEGGVGERQMGEGWMDKKVKQGGRTRGLGRGR